jgi:hypothetical protein
VNYPHRCIKGHLSPTISCLLTTEGGGHCETPSFTTGFAKHPSGSQLLRSISQRAPNCGPESARHVKPSAELCSSKPSQKRVTAIQQPFQSEMCEDLLFGNRSRQGQKTMSGDTALDWFQSINIIERKN